MIVGTKDVPGERRSGRVLVLHPDVKRRPAGGAASPWRSPEARLDEALGLARAIGLQVAHGEVVSLSRTRPATLFGAGKVAELGQLIAAEEIGLVVVDADLSPVQQRNLERQWQVKAIDRTGLILEIFGERARTREGRLQVELAHLSYQRSRLVRSWTHLERQRGGAGFMGGPGEAQIELDRRLIDTRIVKLKRELATVTRTRKLHRASRQKVPNPVVALVGYTNAGKSTLFNLVTQSKAYSADQLFATLDPAMRGFELPSGRRAILSDTVGFISDLPTHLIAAFRATLEEVLEADLILHVRDVAHPDSAAQAHDVRDVLAVLGLGEAASERIVEVANKIDLLDPAARDIAINQAVRNGRSVALSAVTGAGLAQLLERIDAALGRERRTVELTVDLADGRALAWLYRHGEVLSRADDGTVAHLTVGLDPADLSRYDKMCKSPPPADG